MKNKLFLLICLVVNLAFGQDNRGENTKGAIAGTVREGESGETIPNAYVFLQNTDHKTVTDLDGKFGFHHLAFGHYQVLVKFADYPEKLVEVDVVNSETVYIDVNLQHNVKMTEEVTIRARKPMGDLGIELEKKNNAVVSDVISSATLAKTPDRTTSDALKRVSGASVQDNKFVIIRGLNDRYNAAYLNGAPLPSSESDRKAFSFDIFPVNMLDNLTILKTASPDLPGEFAGGVINIKTKDIPENNFQSFSIGGGYNTITTFKDQTTYSGGKLDWLGVDDGTRALSKAIPDHKSFPLLMNDQAALAKTFTTNWDLNNQKFSPNMSFQYSMGVNKSFGKDEKRDFGFIGSLSYNKTNNYNETQRRAFTNGSGVSQIEFDLLDKVYSTQVLAGGMANFSVKINQHNIIGFKNLYSVNSDNRMIARTGEINPLDANPNLLRSNARWFTQNNIYSGQLTGEHLFKKNRLRVDWVGGYSNIVRTIPNLRRSIYSRSKYLNDPQNPVATDTMYSANISSSSVGPDYGGGMFFSTNKENIASLKASISYHLDTIAGIATELKIGGMYQSRHRDFAARQLGYTKFGAPGGSTNFDQNLLYQPEDSIFQPQNMGLIKPGVGGFKLTDGTKLTDAYQASSSLTAGYISLDNKFHKKFRLIWGARAEYFVQQLNATRNDKSALVINTKKLEILPSFNFVYSASKRQNLRLSGSQTLNRPEYRELAPFAFYDFNTQFVLSGNDSLKRAKITNFDLRYEWFPGKNQLISGSLFYKYFENPIEQVARPDVANEISYKNAPYAKNYGIELEFRSIIGYLINSDSASFLNNLTVFSNLSIIRSVVDVSKNIGTAYQTRPLQGQSPYVFNGGVMFEDKNHKMSYTLNVNRVGQRIYILGSISQPDIWEKSRTFLDFQIAKSFLEEKLEVKFNIQNILAQKLIFYQNNYTLTDSPKGFRKATNAVLIGDSQNKNGYSEKIDDTIWSTKFGQTFSFVVVYKF